MGIGRLISCRPSSGTINYRLNGLDRIFELAGDDGSGSRFCTQYMLVENLMREFLENMDGDVRWNVKDVAIYNQEG
jgi:p-hydroxybenzoate 3-monooxygenase